MAKGLWLDLQQLNLLTISIRVVLAIAVGGIIGFERDIKNHPAGFRTYILVCLGAAMVMMTNQYISDIYHTGDPSRMGAQVISGIGFLGAGSILTTSKNHIRGLTTAAGLWSAACIGLAIGIGFYQGAIVGAVAILIIMSFFQRIKKQILTKRKIANCYIIFKNLQAFNDFLAYCATHNWEILTIQNETVTKEEDQMLYFLTIKFNNYHEANDFMSSQFRMKGVLMVKETEE